MATSQEMLDKYLAAEAAILDGQQVRFGDRWLTRANLAEVQAGRKDFERKVAAEANQALGGRGPRYMAPDFR